MRECFSDVRMFNPLNQQWFYCRTFGDIAEARRNHCAALCGRFLFITGGVSSYGRYLNDLCALNLETFKWSIYELQGHYEDGIAFSTGLSLFPAEIKIETPYLTYEYVRKKGKKLVKLGEEGIFLFGGRLGNGEATNDFKVIQLGTKPLVMKKIETKV
jgi:Rab9 effector protein with kelch motifs